MESNRLLHIHWVTNFVVPPPITLSGGDRIMVECLRRWSTKHKVTVYGSEATRQLCDYMQLDRVRHVLWPSARYLKFGRFVLWFAQTILGRRAARSVNLPPAERSLIVASSEFMPNGLPALDMKRRHPHVPLAVGFYLFAPRWFSGKPGPGLVFTLYRPFQQWMLRQFVREAEMILVTGAEDEDILIKEYGRKPDSVFGVRGGVDLSIPRSVPEPAAKDYDAVFIGRLHPMKGVRELVDIWKILQGKRPGARLAVIGSGALDRELKDKTAKLGISDVIRFCGFQDGVEKYKIVKASRVIVHPGTYEVGGMAAAEALACGLPGVTFDHPALRDYYPKGFLKAQPVDLIEFADLVNRLLTEPALYASMSAEALEAGAAWDWDVRAQKILEVLEGVVWRKEST